MKVAVIMNNAAGSMEDSVAQFQRVRELCSSCGLRAGVRSVPGRRICQETAAAVSARVDAVVAAGGDGTISAIAGVLAGGSVPLGILPLGTHNHFARDLAVPVELESALQTVAEGTVRRIDLGEVNGRTFVNNSSLGIYPRVVEEREAQFGRATRETRWLATLWTAARVLSRFPLWHVRIEVNGRELQRTTPFLFVGNNEYTTRLLDVSARASLSSGRLCLYTARCRNLPGFLRLLGHALRGKLDQANDFEAHTSPEFVVRTRRKTARVANDGEVLRMETPLHYRTKPRCLQVFTRSTPPAG